MDCPYCKKEMELGFIQCRDGLNWTARHQPVHALSFLGKGRTSLENGYGGTGQTVFAYKCGDCQKVIVDYSDPTGKAAREELKEKGIKL